MAPVAPYKRATVSDFLFFTIEYLFRSFAHKKQAIRSNEQIPNTGFSTLLGGKITLPGPNENGFVNFLF